MRASNIDLFTCCSFDFKRVYMCFLFSFEWHL